MTSEVLSAERAIAADIAASAAARAPLAIVGGGTKRAAGRPPGNERELSTAGLVGVTLYEPAEMVISARAGTTLAAVEATLAERGQMLPFEPADFRALLSSSGEPTIGGVAALNLSGPRRIQAGACRDSLIGLRYINGQGEILRAGGRVMKNVTGLDVVKLQAGAWGTLGLLTEVTFKVLPAPEFSATLALSGLGDGEGIAALAEALGSPFDVSAAAHAPGLAQAKSTTAVRLEGFESSVRYRADQIARLWNGRGEAELTLGAASRAFWRDIGDVARLAQPGERAIWRVSVKPSAAPSFVAALGNLVRAHLYDWGGGLVWLATEAQGDAGAATIRNEIAKLGDGHAMLLRAPAEIRAAVAVFQPLAPAVQNVQRHLKASLDPAHIFNPGRMYPGL